MPSRQEVPNVVLAELLQDRGLVAAPEEILRGPAKKTRLPDVVIDFQGLRLAIEAEYGFNNRQQAYEKARERVREAIAHLGVAVAYPARLRSVKFERLKRELEHCKLEFAVLTEANEPETQLLLFKDDLFHGAEPSFDKGTVDDLGNAIRRAYEQLVRDETLARAVSLLERIIEGFMAALEGQPATTDRLAQVLGAEPVSESNPRGRRAVNRIAALILANAMIFQEVLSKADRRVYPLRRFRGESSVIDSMADHWAFILKDINYHPIFKTAYELIRCVSADRTVTRTYIKLLNTALDVVGCRASLRHDLAGRIYHRILEEAKYLGAYYTSIPAATLLLKLAIRPVSDGREGAEGAAVPDLRIADLACGTGTLLMAAADALMDTYVRGCAEAGVRPDLDEFHRQLVEKVIHGYDVLPSAIHLTASTLALRAPDTPANVTHLYRLPLGGRGLHLGTLDLLEEQAVAGTLFGETERITGKGGRGGVAVTIPTLDLCVMNPPFTRSVGGNLLFGNLPQEERRPMQRRLQGIVRRHGVRANITAGLGSVFVALADSHIRAGGTIALVLPRALVSGVAWQQTRELLTEKYDVEYVVVSHEADHWNFSENTDLSEVLVVASKRASKAKRVGRTTTFVNLWRQPKNAVESLSLASSLFASSLPSSKDGLKRADVRIGSAKVGEAITVAGHDRNGHSWGPLCAFAQSELILALRKLVNGSLYIPTRGVVGQLPLCRLTTFSKLGFDRRDIHDGFSIAGRKTAYPALWGHDARRVTRLRHKPNKWLSPLDVAKKGRHLRSADHLWTQASHVLIAERLWLKTMRLISVFVSEPVLANVWWPLCIDKEHDSEDARKTLVLWLNSSLGILSTLGFRVETRGAWVDFKKPILENLPVLDPRQLKKPQLAHFGKVFQRLAVNELLPFSEIANDAVRTSIDEAIEETLNLPGLGIIRTLLGREPILCLSNSRLREE